MLWPGNSTPKYLPKRIEKTCPQKDLHKNVQSSIIHDSLKLETTQMFIHKKTDTYTVVYSHNGIWISNKKEQTTDVCNNMSKSQKSCIQKRSQTKSIHNAWKWHVSVHSPLSKQKCLHLCTTSQGMYNYPIGGGLKNLKHNSIYHT